MELACPTCRNSLSVPAQLANPLVRCPHCQTVIDVSPLLATAGAAVGAAAGGFAPGPAAPSFTPAAPSRKLTQRRKKSNGWILVLLMLVAAGGLGFAAVKYNQSKQRAAASHDDVNDVKNVVYTKAQEYVRGHVQTEQPKAAAKLRFGDKVTIKRHTKDGSYVVKGLVDVPMNGGKFVSLPFDVELREESAGQWKLVSLEYNNSLIYAEEPAKVPEFKYAKTNKDEKDDWIYGSNKSSFSGPGQDFYENQSIAWGVESAMAQIKESVELNKTLVVWLFDKSASAAAYRNEAAGVFSHKYRELNAAGEKALLTAIGTFGKEVEFPLEEPTADQSAIESAINAIEQEESGRENVFAAIIAAAEKYQNVRKEQDRLVMIVVVSDEAGDDENQIENALKITKQLTIPVSVVGGRAPFGRRATPGVNLEIANDLGASGKGANLMHQGPETFFPEGISLGFFNPAYGNETSESIDSGFGPYTLTRLTIETGGVYYACRADLGGGMRGGRGAVNWNPGAGLSYTFDPKVMARYKPQYVSEKELQKQLSENKCRKAVVDAAKVPRVETMKFVRTDFPRPRDEAAAKRELDEAQKGAATVEPKVAALYDALKPGEADRAKETIPRYQAAFDLAYGRVLAAKARTEGYNAMLAKMKGGFPFTNDESPMFKLEPDESIDAGSQLAKLIKDSRKYLQRVVDEHPDTPWAFLAKRELETPCGWKWVEQLPAGAMPAAAETEEK